MQKIKLVPVHESEFRLMFPNKVVEDQAKVMTHLLLSVGLFW